MKNEPHNHSHSYKGRSEFEKLKLSQNYKRIGEYEDFYLYVKCDKQGKELYRECFSKFDVDGVVAPKKPRGPWQRHGINL